VGTVILLALLILTSFIAFVPPVLTERAAAITGKAGTPEDVTALATFLLFQKQTGSPDSLSVLTVDVLHFEPKAKKTRIPSTIQSNQFD
jgi:hypothetical protein